MIILTDIGAEKMLKAFFKRSTPAGGSSLKLRLFVTNHTPVDTDILTDYTQAVGGGYAEKTLAISDFTVSTVGGIAVATAPDQTFTFTGALTTNLDIYGYYVCDADDDVIYAELSGGTYRPTNNGDTFIVSPAFQLSKGVPS